MKKLAVVTGANRGVGAEFVRQLDAADDEAVTASRTSGQGMADPAADAFGRDRPDRDRPASVLGANRNGRALGRCSGWYLCGGDDADNSGGWTAGQWQLSRP